MALDFSSQSRRASFAERGLDLYETPSVAIEALLRVEQLPHHIWEPACGRGAIVNVLRSAGHSVVATDIALRTPDHAARLLGPGLPARAGRA